MKRILSCILSLAMLLSMLCIPVSAEDWAPTATSYTADFSNADEVSKWQLARGTNVPVVSGDSLIWGAAASTVYVLPTAKMENFVLKTEITHTDNENNFAVHFGLDGAAPTNLDKFKVRFKANQTRADFYNNGANRDSNSIYGAYQWNIKPYYYDDPAVLTDIYQTSALRVVVYNGRLAAWMNDQLVYSCDLSEAYAAGYIGIEANHYGLIMRNLSVREATASDLVFAESFNEASKQGYTALVSTALKTKNWGAADMARANWITYVDTNKTTVGDHMYSAGYTFGSTNYGPTRFLINMFGIKDNADGTKSGWGVATKMNGEIVVSKITIKADGTFTTSDTKIASDSVIRAMFPDKVQKMTYSGVEYDVLKLDTMWEYRHVLSNGTLYIYLDDVLVGTCKKDEFKELSGYTGFASRGMNSMIYYTGVRGAEAEDLNRPNKVRVRLGDANGNFETLGEKIIRLYTVETTVDEATQLPVVTETLYGTAYVDANGMFDMELGHNQAYDAKLYSSGDGELVATKNITYNNTGEVFNLDFVTDADFSTLVDLSFNDGVAVDASTNANTFTFYEQAKTEAMDAFGGNEALVLDGVGDAARFDSAGALVLNDADKLTAEAVFIPRERDGIKEMSVLGGRMSISSSKKGGFGIYVDQDNDGNDVISFRISAGENVLSEVNAPCEMNKAYYVAGVYDGTSMKLYINGALATAKAVSGDIVNIDSFAAAIGAEWYYLNDLRKFFFKGEIANIEITNGAKTEADIATAYAEYVNAGYKLGNEAVTDVTTKVTFSNEEPVKGDVVTVNVAVRNNTDADKTVTVKMNPGYFAALTEGENDQEITVAANSIVNVEFTYKMLAGGREPFRAYVYENGAEVAYDIASLSVIGAGYYKSETHNHSTRSDGTNAYEENVLEGFATKNLSYAFSTEHNQYNYWNYKKALDTSAMYNPQQFVVYGTAGEYTTPQGHVNIYELNNDVSTQSAGAANQPFWNEASRPAAYEFVSENGAATAAGWNKLINLSVNEQGGYLYINHPNDPTYYVKDELIKDMRGFTGMEIWNGAQTCFDTVTLHQRNSWDKVNSIGWGHVIGQAGTDAHGSVGYGTIQKVAYLSELSHDEIVRVVADGNAIGTNGPEVRFDINGAPLNGTAVVEDGKASFNIDVYDPMGDILVVKLIKNVVSGEFTTDNREETVLYEKADGAEAIGAWKYNEIRDVLDGEFYRVEVTTAKTPYGSLSSNGTTTQGEGSNMGWAFTNNIWIETEGTSNSTNISEISVDSETIEIEELDTGIMYLRGLGELALSDITVVSDGEAVVTENNGIITITVTADDGTEATTEMYLVGNITMVDEIPETTIECDSADCTSTSATATVTINDEEGLIRDDGAVVVMAVYCGGILIGVNIEPVTASDTEKNLAVVYPEQTDVNALSVKAMLVKDMSSVRPLAKVVTAAISVE